MTEREKDSGREVPWYLHKQRLQHVEQKGGLEPCTLNTTTSIQIGIEYIDHSHIHNNVDME